MSVGQGTGPDPQVPEDAHARRRPPEPQREQAPEPTSDRRLLAHLWPYIARHPLALAGAMALFALNALCVVLPPYFLRPILDEAIPRGDLPRLRWLSILYLGALTLELASGFASELSTSILGQKAMQRLRQDLFAHVQRLPMAFFERNPIGRILTRLTTDVEALGDVFATGAITIIGDVLTVVAVVIMMFNLDGRLTLFSFALVPPLVGLAGLFQVYARRAFRSIRMHIARINAFLAEHVSTMDVVQAFNQQGRTQAEFDALNAAFRDANRQAIFFDATLFAMVEALGTIAVAALLWFGARDLALGSVSAGTLVAFIQYLRRFFVPIRDLSTKWTVLQSALAAAERTHHLLREPLILHVPEDAPAPGSLREALHLQGVWFSYRAQPGEADWILRDITLRIRRGERLALVGHTGSGKTTLLKLLNRFYDTSRGSVCLDGVDIRQLNLGALRRRFAIVSQDVQLLRGSVMQNLTFAGRASEVAARRAIDMVRANAIIERLPNGYDSMVQQLGQNFSAGERQLLALARALALDPDILILDEATSNVDSDTEAHIQSALDVVLAHRTAVVVAHRLSTVKKVDRIIVLHAGRIVQEGSHDALMRRQGAYRDLVEQQLQGEQGGA